MTFTGRITESMVRRATSMGDRFVQFPELYARFTDRLRALGAINIERSDDPFMRYVTVRVTFPDGSDIGADMGLMGFAPLPKPASAIQEREPLPQEGP